MDFLPIGMSWFRLGLEPLTVAHYPCLTSVYIPCAKSFFSLSLFSLPLSSCLVSFVPQTLSLFHGFILITAIHSMFCVIYFLFFDSLLYMQCVYLYIQLPVSLSLLLYISVFLFSILFFLDHSSLLHLLFSYSFHFSLFFFSSPLIHRSLFCFHFDFSAQCLS